MRNAARCGGPRAGLLWIRAFLAEPLEPRTLLSSTNPLDVKHGPLAKVGSELIGLWRDYRGFLQTHGAEATSAFHSNDPLLHVGRGSVAVETYTRGSPTTLAAELAAVGATNVRSYVNGASALVPIRQIVALAALPDLSTARPVLYTTNAGSVTSQGDPAIRGDAGRNQFAIDGSGVKVGILSDSFDASGHGSAAADVGTGDLPAAGVQVLADSPNGTDEGRAMAQIVHDTAPGAGIAFATAKGGKSAFALNIIQLHQAGCDVLVDDTSYPDEPMFQDGIIAQAVDAVVASGASYFSAAGNQGSQSYESPFRPGPTVLGMGVTHDFDPGPGVDNMQAVTLAPGQNITLAFQWDQPFGTESGTSGNACQSDLDIYLMDATGTDVRKSSIDDNIFDTTDPFEYFSYTNTTGSTQNYQLMIAIYDGAAPGLMKYINYGAPAFTEYNTNSSTVFGHANAAGAAGVAAAPYFRTPAFGVNPPVVEPNSSLGGTPILFDTAGNRLGSQVTRPSPRFTAPDGGNTTFFGADDASDPDTFPNFYGTSAAASAAAAVAALMLQLAPNMSPASVYSTLQNTAQDMGAAGYDLTTGSGLIRADAAIASVLGITTSGGATYEVTGSAGNRLLNITAGTVTLGKTLSTFYPGISLSVSGAATAVFAVDQSFFNVTLSGNGAISVTQLPAGGGSGLTTGGDPSVTPTPTPTPTPTSSQSLTLNAATSGYARDGAYAGADLSADPTLVVKKGPLGYNRETFLTFDLSKLVGIGPVHMAHLRLFGRLTGNAPAGVRVGVSAASGTWSKGNLSWNHRPATAGSAALATASVTGTQGRWYDWDLTAFLKAQQAAGRSVVTLALRGVSATTAAALFDSGKGGKGPRLVVG